MRNFNYATEREAREAIVAHSDSNFDLQFAFDFAFDFEFAFAFDLDSSAVRG